MCLIALAIAQSDRFPWVVAGNRDEAHARPTAPLHWWDAPASSASPGLAVLGGRDLAEGGGWLALGVLGRLALVTNRRGPQAQRTDAPSRGHLVTAWLSSGSADASAWWQGLAPRHHNPFNLVVADLASGGWHAAGSDEHAMQRLGPGVHGVSNGLIDEPWPKVERLAQGLRDALCARSAGELVRALLARLADRTAAPDDRLPSTGVPLELERALSSVFIHMPERGYGTRSSSVVVCERLPGGVERVHVVERRFDAQGLALPLLRRATITGFGSTPIDAAGIAVEDVPLDAL